MAADKEFRSIDDQLNLLTSRNLIIQDVDSARKNLIEKNYFDLINGFETLLLDDPKAMPKHYTDVRFEDFLSLYEFDKRLRSIILLKISEIENKLKTAMAYHFSKNHCTPLANNNNYVNMQSFSAPTRTSAPKWEVKNFKTHKIFKKDYPYIGSFRGNFNGTVVYNSTETELHGTFTGKFGTTSINKISGICTLRNSYNASLIKRFKTINSKTGSTISLKLNFEPWIFGMNYIDYCKTKYLFINEYYNNPPFWVVIKTFMLNDLILLLYGFKKTTFNEILNEFGLKPVAREKFFNSLQIIRELRNTCAHFELVNRFRTSQALLVERRLINELALNPIRSQYIIKLYDTLKVLGLYVDIAEVVELIFDYYSEISPPLGTALLNRMGNADIEDWINIC